MKRTTRKKFTGGGKFLKARNYSEWLKLKYNNYIISSNIIINGIINGHKFSTDDKSNLEVWIPVGEIERESFFDKRKTSLDQCGMQKFRYEMDPKYDYMFVSETDPGWGLVKRIDSKKICEYINMGYKFSSGKDGKLRVTIFPYDDGMLINKDISEINKILSKPIENPIEISSKSRSKSPKSPSKSPSKSPKSPSKSPKSPSKSPKSPSKSPNKSHKLHSKST